MAAIYVKYIFPLYFYIQKKMYFWQYLPPLKSYAYRLLSRWQGLSILLLYYNVEVECIFSLDVMYYSYYFLLPREQFFPYVLSGDV